MIGHQIGFASQEIEFAHRQLPVAGHIPDWLCGSLIRTGPVKYEVGEESYRHWFDGLAGLQKFSFGNQKVIYTSKLLNSQAYLKAQAKGKIVLPEFASKALGLAALFPQMLTDNGNVNICRQDDQYLALTETTNYVGFDPHSLQATGRFAYKDGLCAQLTTAHGQFDPALGQSYNVLVQMSLNSKYVVTGLSRSQRARKPLCHISVSRPSYLHSFGMSQRYLIVMESPYKVNPLDLIFGSKPYIENYCWQKSQACRFHVIDKDGGRVQTIEGEPCFIFHHVNAFEQGDEVVLDVLAYPDAQIIQELYLSNLRRENAAISAAKFKRIYLDLRSGRFQAELLCNQEMELPAINYSRHNMRNYRFAYAAGRSDDTAAFLDCLVKLDLQQGNCLTWRQAGCFPGEPVFASNRQAVAEDDGIILSVVLNAQVGQSFLLLLDAGSFREICRIAIPQIIPFGFHGQFFCSQEDLCL